MAKHKCLMCGDEFPIELMFETLVCGNCIDADGSDLAKSEAELAQVKAERDRLREDYNAMREQINNVNKVYWEYDDWDEKAGEMKLSIEAILAIFPEIESEE